MIDIDQQFYMNIIIQESANHVSVQYALFKYST